MNYQPFDEFRQYFPEIAKQVVSSVETSPFELKIVCNGGEVLFYDRLNQTIRRQKTITANTSKDEWQKIFANNFQRKMRSLNLSTKELSELTGISVPLLSNYTNGKKIPGGYKLTKILDALHCTFEELLGR